MQAEGSGQAGGDRRIAAPVRARPESSPAATDGQTWGKRLRKREGTVYKPDLGHGEELNLKAGDWVEVRGREEILATLDESGRLDNLPFMPEMLEYCGQRLRVYKRADKTCEYTQGWSIRRMTTTVPLEGARCEGSGHDGCQAGCLIFWKEAWLKRTENGMVRLESLGGAPAIPASFNGLITVENL